MRENILRGMCMPTHPVVQNFVQVRVPDPYGKKMDCAMLSRKITAIKQKFLVSFLKRNIVIAKIVMYNTPF